MRLLSIVGVKTSCGQRATIVQSGEVLFERKFEKFFKTLSKTTVLLAVTFLFLFLQIREYAPVMQIQSSIMEVLTPLIDGVSVPIHVVSQSLSNIQHYLRNKEHLLAENLALKLQNDDLIRQRDALKQTTIENKKLREALKIHSSLNENFITVQVSHHTHDGYSQTFYTKVPVDHEIDKNSPVLTTKGYLVGRVVGTHQRLFGKRGLQKKMSQIMPISDPASRIPVKIEGTGDRAILKGKGNNPLELTRIENVSKFKVGQRLVTSGEGGFFPPGVPVAEITKITQGGSSIQARPLGKINDLDLDFVLILPTV